MMSSGAMAMDAHQMDAMNCTMASTSMARLR